MTAARIQLVFFDIDIGAFKLSVLINRFVASTFCFCFSFTGINFQACYITFLTWPMTKTCVDQSELVNIGGQIDKLPVWDPFKYLAW